MLLPALETLPLSASPEFVLVFRQGSENTSEEPLLCGLFPIEPARTYKGLPLRMARVLCGRYCFDGTPLVHSSHTDDVLKAFLGWLASPEGDCSVLEMPLLHLDGPVYQSLTDVLRNRLLLTFVDVQYTRALYQVPPSPSSYLASGSRAGPGSIYAAKPNC